MILHQSAKQVAQKDERNEVGERLLKRSATHMQRACRRLPQRYCVPVLLYVPLPVRYLYPGRPRDRDGVCFELVRHSQDPINSGLRSIVLEEREEKRCSALAFVSRP